MACDRAFEDDRVSRYLGGELSDPERDAFEIHVLECEACRAALEAHQDLADALRARARPVRKDAGVRLPRWLPMAAMFAVTVIAGTIALRRPSPTAAPQTPWRTHPGAPSPGTPAVREVPGPPLEKPDVVLSADRVLVTRGGGDDAFLKDFGPAIEAYRKDDYAVAAERLGALAPRYPKAFEVPFYQGVSLLLVGRAPEAADTLQRARPLARGRQREDVDWYLGLALMRAGQTGAGLSHLGVLCAGDGPRKPAACAAVRILEGPPSAPPPAR